jgi:ankyrin repeat protein
MFEDTPLLIVAALDLVPLARLLLQYGAKVQYFDENGNGKDSPLHMACSAEMVNLLLDHGANADLLDQKTCPPLFWYVREDNIPSIRTILQRSSKGYWYLPEHYPIQGTYDDAIWRRIAAKKLFMEHGIFLQPCESNDRNTLLHLAAWCGLVDAFPSLLQESPQAVQAKNREEETPLHLAAAGGDVEAVRFLLELWPEGKGERNIRGLTPWQQFLKEMKDPDEQDMEEMRALLGEV